MKDKKRRRLSLFLNSGLIATLTLVVVLLYNLPRWIPQGSDLFPVVADTDGEYYAYRLKMALKGEDPSLSCVENPSLRSSSTWMPWREDQAWASILRPWVGTEIIPALNATYLVFPAILFLFLTFILYQLTEHLLLSLALSLFGLTAPSVFFWKPFFLPGQLGGLSPLESLPFFRFANPLLRSLGTGLALGATLHWLKKTESGKPVKPVLSGLVILCLGLPFFSQVYYWTWLMATWVGYIMISLSRGEFSVSKKLGTLLGVVFLFAFPFLFGLLQQSRDPLFIEVLNRVGCMLQIYRPYFLWHAGMIFTFVVYQVVAWREKDWRWKFCTSGMISGWLLLNQNLITGVYNQEHHYFRPLVFLYVCVLADLLNRLRMRLTPEKKFRSIVNAAIWIGIVLILINGVMMSRRIALGAAAQNGVLSNAQKLRETLIQSRSLKTDAPNVALMNPSLSYIFGLSSDVFVYVHEYLHQCMVSDNELFLRWVFHWRAYGMTRAQIKPLFKSASSVKCLPWWLYGLPSQYSGIKDRHSPKDRKEMGRDWLKSYENADFDEVVQSLASSHGFPNLAIESPGYKLNQVLLKKYFKLELLKKVPEEGTAIWKLTPKL